jgi:hypothetical protein
MRGNKVLFFIFLLFLSYSSFCQEDSTHLRKPDDSVAHTIDFLRNYFFEDSCWQVVHPEIQNTVEGLLHFVLKRPVDSLASAFQAGEYKGQRMIIRFPSEVSDTLHIQGYMPVQDLKTRQAEIRRRVIAEFMTKDPEVPDSLLKNIEERMNRIPPEQGMRLITDSVYSLPDSLQFLDVLPDSMVQTTEDFQRIVKLDSIRDAFIEKYRLHYNDSLVSAYRDSMVASYRNQALEKEIRNRIKQYSDSVKRNNYRVVEAYNDRIIQMVNDSVYHAINDLIRYANRIDTVDIHILNLADRKSRLTLSDHREHYTRVWLKNRQNDSLSVLVSSPDKRTIRMVIDDNVTFSRMSQKQAKGFQLVPARPSDNLRDIQDRFKIETPWSIGGDGTVGFTQAYLSNWKKGGKSAISMLLVLKGFANYSTFNNIVKWENSMELRNGWINPGGRDKEGNRYELEKNDDKFEVISRFGLSAFKKWYYSAEVDFQTQLFKGFQYPTSVNPQPISAFLSPAKTVVKIGFDYKPNADLSVFLSPFTSKTVSIRDTVLINKSNYNIPDGRKKLWVPGLNADIRFKAKILPEISYETKYKMFINYTRPFEKFDIDWENLVVMKVNDYINMRLMLHLIYDDDILFPVYDQEGKELYKKTRLQVKELITVGFSYNINKKVYKAHRIN